MQSSDWLFIQAIYLVPEWAPLHSYEAGSRRPHEARDQTRAARRGGEKIRHSWITEAADSCLGLLINIVFHLHRGDYIPWIYCYISTRATMSRDPFSRSRQLLSQSLVSRTWACAWRLLLFDLWQNKKIVSTCHLEIHMYMWWNVKGRKHLNLSEIS